MARTEKKNQAKKVPKAPLAAPGNAAAAAASGSQVRKNPLYEKRPRNYRIGGDIQPKRNLTRFVKWPAYIRLQRQKRILLQRLKVPPSIAQFSHTTDKTSMAQLARLCKKLAPETKKEKAQRIKEMAGQKAVTTNKSMLPVLKFGINHVTELVEEKKAKLVLIAADVDPIELVCWLPTLCRKKDVAFCIVKGGKSKLGQYVGKKSATCVAICGVPKELTKELEVAVESANTNFNLNKEVARKWGGGIMGVKSQHVTRRKAQLLERELAKKTGMAA